MLRWLPAPLLSLPVSVAALQCPDMPRQATRDTEVEVRVGVRGLGDAKGADLESRTRAMTTELLSKVPRADRVYLEQMLFAAYCSAVRDNPALAESEREARVAAYAREMRRTLAAPPPAAAKPAPDPRGQALSELQRMAVPFTLAAFEQAVRDNNLRVVQVFIAAGFDVNLRNPRGLGALYLSLSRGQREMAESLLAGGARPDGASLAFMVDRDDLAGLRRLLAHKPSPEAVGYGFQSAVASGNLAAMKLMLEQGASVSAHGTAAAANAANSNFGSDNPGIADTLGYLKAQGIDIDQPDANGWTPLLSAAMNGRVHMVRALLSLGADVNRRCACVGYRGGGMTPLLVALNGRHGELARLLLDAGADARVVAGDGTTPLHLVADRMPKDVALAASLIDRGVPVDSTDREGMTPLLLAVHGDVALIGLLAAKGASLTIHSPKGHTPLSFAAALGNNPAVEALLVAGAPIDGLTGTRRTALAVAVRNDRIDTVRLLLQRGARTDIADENSMTPLDHAQALSGEAKLSMVRLLQTAGVR